MVEKVQPEVEKVRGDHHDRREGDDPEPPPADTFEEGVELVRQGFGLVVLDPPRLCVRVEPQPPVPILCSLGVLLFRKRLKGHKSISPILMTTDDVFTS